jgi:allantoicase
MSFDSAWADAENTVMTELCRATGSTNGKNAFLGYLPPMVNVWALFTGGQGGNEQTTWTPDVVSIHLGARIEAAFAKREHATAFCMQVIKALPITTGNVQCFRIRMGGYPEPQPDFIPLANEDRKIPAWLLTIGCELVFSTGGR